MNRQAGTTQSFVLLIVVFMTGSAALLQQVLTPLTDPGGKIVACELAAGVNLDTDSPANDIATSSPAYSRCLHRNVGGWGDLWMPYLLALLILVLAVAYYLLLPKWKARSSAVVPLAEGYEIGAALTCMAADSGLSRTPDFVVDLSAHGASAAVFGRLGRYTVRLDAGLVALFGRDPVAFKATVLHELAHIRNRDVDLTYATVSMWRGFLCLALLPFALQATWHLVHGELAYSTAPTWSGYVPSLARDLCLTAFLVAMMYLATADILRAREIHADSAAILNGADPSYWSKHADSQAGRPTLRAVLGTHPSWQTRTTALNDRSILSTVRAPTMFLTGAAAASLEGFLDDLSANGTYGPWGGDAQYWLPAALTTAVAGLAIWRQVTYNVRARLPVPSGLRAGAWLGAGNLAAVLLLSQATVNRWLPPFPEVLMLCLPVLVPMAVLWWTAGCAAAWAGLPAIRLRLAAAATLAVAAATFCWWYTWWSQIGAAFAHGNADLFDPVYATMFKGYLHTTTTDAMATLMEPIAQITVDRWNVWLPAGLMLVPLLALTSRRLPAAAGCGLLGGAAAILGSVAVTAYAHASIATGRLSITQNMDDYIGQMFALLLGTTLAAALLALVVTRGRAAAAMAAAGITMAVGLAATFVLTQSDGCIGPLTLLELQCSPPNSADWQDFTFLILYLPAMAGTTTLAISAVAASLLKPAEPPPSDHTRDAQPRRTSLAWPAITCLTILSACAVAYQVDTHSSSSTYNPPTPSISAPKQIVNLQASDWLLVGGTQLIHQLTAASTAISQGTGKTDQIYPAAMRRGCSEMTAATAAANAYFPPPDGQQSAWTTAWSNLGHAAGQCLENLDRSNDRGVLASLLLISDANSQIQGITQRLMDETQ